MPSEGITNGKYEAGQKTHGRVIFPHLSPSKLDVLCEIASAARRRRKSVSVSKKNALCSCMTEFDYSAPAELYAAQGRQGFRYRRFLNAGEAIRYAVEKLPTNLLPVRASSLRIGSMTASKSTRCMKVKGIRCRASHPRHSARYIAPGGSCSWRHSYRRLPAARILR